MKQIIDFIGKPIFVLCTWILLIVFSLWCVFLLNQTTYWALQFILSFFLFFGTMAFGFFYFQAYPTHRIWGAYYTKKAFESKRLYRCLGVELFRKFLIKSPFKRLNQRVYLKGRKEYISIFYEETKRSETSHIVGLVLGTTINVYLFSTNHFVQGWFSILFNAFMNFYPILLQRYNRIKIKS